jgi:hypothetical protein
VKASTLRDALPSRLLASLLAGLCTAAAARDFIGLDPQGNPLPDAGDEAAPATCLLDTGSGLVWEIKTTDGGLRDWRWTYTPYDSNNATNGGVPGFKDGTSGDCLRAQMKERSCNTEAYIAAVNASGLCGFDDWRLPTVAELVAISTQSAQPATDHATLPNIYQGWYWTGLAGIGASSFSRVVLLPHGAAPTFYDGSYLVLAVRGGAAQ